MTGGLPLSICIPTYNRARLLDRTLRHLSECHRVFTEVVVSDNASPDDTRAVVERWRPRFARLRYARQPENVGAFRNIYAAQSLAGERYAFVLSDDDALMPDGIAEAVALLERDPGCVAVYGGYERCTADLSETSFVWQPPFPGRYGRADKLALARNGNVLSFGVLRSAVAQRHCFMDDTSLGLLRMMGQLADHGALEVVPYALYRHAETEGRLEDQLVRPDYHDRLRADWELFAAAVDDVDLTVTTSLVVNYTLPVQMLAHGVAVKQNLPLAERSFLTRYVAYLGKLDTTLGARLDSWERHRLTAAALSLLGERLRTAAPRRLVVQTGPMNLPALIDALGDAVPALPRLDLDEPALRALPTAPGDFLIAEYWPTLAARREPPDGLSGQVAMADLIASLRIPGSSRPGMLMGPGGSVHTVEEPAS